MVSISFVRHEACRQHSYGGVYHYNRQKIFGSILTTQFRQSMDSILLRFDFDYFKFYLQPALIIVNFRCYYAISYCLFDSDSNQLAARMVGNCSLIQPIRHGKTEKNVECAYFFAPLFVYC